MRCDVLGHEATIGLWYLATGFNPALHMRSRIVDWKRDMVEEEEEEEWKRYAFSGCLLKEAP
jgi:hypothetical protein